jgi:hypothetical protein
MKKTKWFDGSKTVPFHVGVYKVKPAYRGARSYFSYWDGKKFCGISRVLGNAECIGLMGFPLHFSSFGWQGLAVKP